MLLGCFLRMETSGVNMLFQWYRGSTDGSTTNGRLFSSTSWVKGYLLVLYLLDGKMCKLKKERETLQELPRLRDNSRKCTIVVVVAVAVAVADGWW